METIGNIPRTLWWGVDDETDGREAVFILDQTRLPLQGDLLVCRTYGAVITAIQSLAVRGAPALGVAAALAVAVWTVNESEEADTPSFLSALDTVVDKVSAARPTAVNLQWGAHRIKDLAHSLAEQDTPLEELKERIVEEACRMQEEDEQANRKIGEHGATLFKEPSKVLTHCNAGSLATAYYGTALGVIYTAFSQGNIEHVWVDETRPVNQGGRLTAWELRAAGIPSALIADNMAASIMQEGWVDAVIVGADRICANGDTANKIGTYSLAVLCAAHDIPFYVAAPTSTIDFSLATGEEIEIEQRDPRELEGVTVSGMFEPNSPAASTAFDSLTNAGSYEFALAKGHQMVFSRKGGAYAFDAWFKTTPPGIEIYNPAFDVTPAKYITAVITENGIAEGDYTTQLKDIAVQ